MRTERGSITNWTIQLAEVGKDAVNGYVEILKKSGWEIKFDMELPDGATFQAAKDSLLAIGIYKNSGQAITLGMTLEN